MEGLSAETKQLYDTIFHPSAESLTELMAYVGSLSTKEKNQMKKPLKEVLKVLQAPIRDDWHAGMEGILRARGKLQNLDAFVLVEYELGTDPPRFDYLITKELNEDFDGPAFEHFRTDNVIEYKPGTLDEDAIFQVCGYGNLYCVMPQRLKKVDKDMVTLTVLCGKRNEALFARLEDEKRLLPKEGTEGVYQVLGYSHMPLYIVVTGELKGERYAAYRAISEDPAEEDIKAVLDQWNAHPELRNDLNPAISLIMSKHESLFKKVYTEGNYMKQMVIMTPEELKEKEEETAKAKQEAAAAEEKVKAIQAEAEEKAKAMQAEAEEEKASAVQEAKQISAIEAHQETARWLIANVEMPLEQIAECTRLPLAEIMELAKRAKEDAGASSV